MTLQIRPFTPEDYPAVVAVHNASEPDYPETESEWRDHDARRPAKIRWGRLVGEVDGEVVGVGYYGQSIDTYHPRKFYVSAQVRPEHRGRGFGAALYDAVVRELEPVQPIALNTTVRADREGDCRFAERRGFRETMREWESRLDVRTWDPGPFATTVERVQASGIRIRTVAELQEDPDRDRKLYELATELEQDVPSTDPPQPIGLETFQNLRLYHPNRPHDGWFLAVDGDRYVGMSNLHRMEGADHLDVGLTGVVRSHRRRGIALALKVYAAEYARRLGAPEIRTWNATTNEGMLAINTRLGFQRQPAWIFLVKEIARES